MAFKLVFLALATVLATSNAVIIDCSYYTTNYGWGAGPVYTCMALVNTLDNSEAITAVTNSIGNADPALTTVDVKWFGLSNGYNLRIDHLPSNMATIFPNLVGLQWPSSRLRTIKPSDLSPYPNLVFLGLSSKLIRELDGNLFQNNHKLELLDLSMNAIQKTGTGLLSGLKALTYVGLYSNPCTGMGSQIYLNPPYNTIADVSRDLDFVCGPEVPGTSQPSGPCDPCLANCTARAAALQIRVDAVTESVYAPWYYKMRQFFKALSLR